MSTDRPQNPQRMSADGPQDGRRQSIAVDDLTLPSGALIPEEPELSRRQRRQTRPAWRQPLAVVGAALGFVWILLAVLAPVIAPADPIAQDFSRFLPPSSEHLMGTDGLGRDVEVGAGGRHHVR